MASHMERSRDATSHGQYIIDPELSAELARQRSKSHMVTRAMGGLAPWLGNLARFHSVLDVACGPGGWGLEVAAEYCREEPPVQVVGIDISEAMIKYARDLASDLKLTHARFQVMDATRALDFPDASFDLIHTRFLIEFMHKDDWLPLLQECMRILRPGGVLTMTEFEMGMANSYAHQYLTGLFLDAMYKAGRSFSPDGRHLGIVHELEPLLQKAGFRDTRNVAHGINYAAGTPQHEAWRRDLLILAKLTLPFLIRSGVAPEEELVAWIERLSVQMENPNFHGILFLLTAWGVRP